MKYDNFELALSGGHPNSLGNTVEVVDVVLKNPERFEELFECYFCEDEVVRLRVSSCIKRIQKVKPDLVYGYIDRFLDDVSKIDQASTQWTLAQLFLVMEKKLTDREKQKAINIMKRNLQKSDDWIVLIQSMVTLGQWAKDDQNLAKWLRPILIKLSKDERKSVAGKSKKMGLTYLPHGRIFQN
ncbi:hypothetical protein HC864_02850 [Candidatus Gracilibacteria bacterium]|nr:hypothetical protein [Candidatus Gracilibacteria bacterium]